MDGSECGLGIHLKSKPWPASAKPSNPSSSRSAHYARLSGPIRFASHTHTLCRCAESASSKRTYALSVIRQIHVSLLTPWPTDAQAELAYDKRHCGEEYVGIAGFTFACILQADPLKAIPTSPLHRPRGWKMKSMRELCSAFRTCSHGEVHSIRGLYSAGMSQPYVSLTLRRRPGPRLLGAGLPPAAMTVKNSATQVDSIFFTRQIV